MKGAAAEGKFTEEHCKTKAETGKKGEWEHKAIAAGTKTSLKLKSLKATVLASEPGGALVELSSETAECVGCEAENAGAAGAMEVKGSGGKLRFSNVIVVKAPTKCEVKSATGVAKEILTNPFKEPAPKTVFTQTLDFCKRFHLGL